MDVYVYASGDSNPEFVVTGVSYGTVSSYRSVSAGDYSVKMLKTGSAASSQPVLTTDLTVKGGKSYTAAALSTKGQGAQLKVLNDELTTPAGQSRVRVIQASVKQDAVKFHCSCAPGAPGNIVTKALTNTRADDCKTKSSSSIPNVGADFRAGLPAQARAPSNSSR